MTTHDFGLTSYGFGDWKIDPGLVANREILHVET